MIARQGLGDGELCDDGWWAGFLRWTRAGAVGKCGCAAPPARFVLLAARVQPRLHALQSTQACATPPS